MVVRESQEIACPPTEHVPQCPLCKSSDAEFMFSAWDRLHQLSGKVRTGLLFELRLGATIAAPGS